MPSNTRITVERNKIGKEDMLLLANSDTGPVQQTRAGQEVTRNPIKANDIEYRTGVSIADALENPHMNFPAAVKNILSSAGSSANATTLHIISYLDTGTGLADVPATDELYVVMVHANLADSGTLSIKWKDRPPITVKSATGSPTPIELDEYTITAGDFIFIYFTNDEFRYLGTLGNVHVRDIEDNLTSHATDKALSANQGRVLNSKITGTTGDVLLSSLVSGSSGRDIEVTRYVDGTGVPDLPTLSKVFIVQIPSGISTDTTDTTNPFRIKWKTNNFLIYNNLSSTSTNNLVLPSNNNLFKAGDIVAFVLDTEEINNNRATFVRFVANLTKTRVVNNTTSHSTTDALSADRGRALSLSLAETSNRSVDNRNNISTINNTEIPRINSALNENSSNISNNASDITSLQNDKLSKTPVTQEPFKLQGISLSVNSSNVVTVTYDTYASSDKFFFVLQLPTGYSISSGHPQIQFIFSDDTITANIHAISKTRLNANHQEFRGGDIILLYYNGENYVFLSRYTTTVLASVKVSKIPEFFKYFDVVNHGDGIKAIFQEMGINEVEIALAQFAKYVASTRFIGSTPSVINPTADNNGTSLPAITEQTDNFLILISLKSEYVTTAAPLIRWVDEANDQTNVAITRPLKNRFNATIDANHGLFRGGDMIAVWHEYKNNEHTFTYLHTLNVSNIHRYLVPDGPIFNTQNLKQFIFHMIKDRLDTLYTEPGSITQGDVIWSARVDRSDYTLGWNSTNSLLNGAAHRIGDIAFSNPPNDLTDAEKAAVRTAIGSGSASGGEENVQADWNVTTTTSDAYIKNKPTIPTLPTDDEIGDKAFSNPPNDLTDVEKSAARTAIGAGTGSGSGGEENVQADWNETDTASDAYIENKPTIPSVPTDSEIGDKAFSNPPTDLTNDEKEAVRNAVDLGNDEIGTTAFTHAPTTLTSTQQQAVRNAIGAGTGGGGGASIATDAEFTAGTVTDKAPSVKQVADRAAGLQNILVNWNGLDGSPLTESDPVPTRSGVTTGNPWDSTNNRWNLLTTSSNDARALYWENKFVDWSKFAMSVDVEQTAANWGCTIFWGNAKSNPSGIGDVRDTGGSGLAFEINDLPTTSPGITVDGVEYTEFKAECITDITDSQVTRFNGALAPARDVYFRIPIKGRMKILITQLSEELKLYVNSVHFLTINLTPAQVQAASGAKFGIGGNGSSSKNAYLYSMFVGSPGLSTVLTNFAPFVEQGEFDTALEDVSDAIEDLAGLYEGNWDTSNLYEKGDVVFSTGQFWVAKQDISTARINAPTNDLDYWTQTSFSIGIVTTLPTFTDDDEFDLNRGRWVILSADQTLTGTRDGTGALPYVADVIDTRDSSDITGNQITELKAGDMLRVDTWPERYWARMKKGTPVSADWSSKSTDVALNLLGAYNLAEKAKDRFYISLAKTTTSGVDTVVFDIVSPGTGETDDPFVYSNSDSFLFRFAGGHLPETSAVNIRLRSGSTSQTFQVRYYDPTTSRDTTTAIPTSFWSYHAVYRGYIGGNVSQVHAFQLTTPLTDDYADVATGIEDTVGLSVKGAKSIVAPHFFSATSYGDAGATGTALHRHIQVPAPASGTLPTEASLEHRVVYVKIPDTYVPFNGHVNFRWGGGNPQRILDTNRDAEPGTNHATAGIFFNRGDIIAIEYSGSEWVYLNNAGAISATNPRQGDLLEASLSAEINARIIHQQQVLFSHYYPANKNYTHHGVHITLNFIVSTTNLLVPRPVGDYEIIIGNSVRTTALNLSVHLTAETTKPFVSKVTRLSPNLTTYEPSSSGKSEEEEYTATNYLNRLNANRFIKTDVTVNGTVVGTQYQYQIYIYDEGSGVSAQNGTYPSQWVEIRNIGANRHPNDGFYDSYTQITSNR